MPLVVDRYEDCLHFAEFERPHEHTPAEHGDWLDLMKRTAGEVLEIPPANIFLKRRQRQRGPSQYERVAEEGRTKIVSEGGLRFEINLSDYLDTGLFLDHRITRGMVREAAAGKRFLNLFAYTGSFTVYAAAGGAAATLSVDLSATHLDWAGRNMAAQRPGRPAPPVRPRRRPEFSGRLPAAAAIRPGGGRSADVFQQQAAGRILGHPARSRRVAPIACWSG